MNPSSSPFNQASEFFGIAFNDLTQASEKQTRMQGKGFSNTQYDSEYDSSYMEGNVEPQTGAFGSQQGPVNDIESVKKELLSTARQKNRPSNGTVSVRAGGGLNPAVRG